MKNPIEIYIHIPFCVRKCAYCDFLSAPATREIQQEYVRQLLEEIGQAAELSKEYKVVTLFFGGGTPSILPEAELVRIVDKLQQVFFIQKDAEITVEANPGTVDLEKLQAYHSVGINRISFGLQSADNDELKRLGRIHTWEQFLESFGEARKAGFQNINVDLMSALPGQTKKSWLKTLNQVVSLEPEHISAYSLMIEEGTPFYQKYHQHPELLPSEAEERQMYYDTKEVLKSRGYHRYEISNYAKKDLECRHNLGYWNRTEYKGFGLGAASLLGNIRTSNQDNLSEYLKGNFAGSQIILTEQDIREEYFFLGLRKMEGINPGKYRSYYQNLLDKLKMQQLLEEREDKIFLTDKGIDVSNYVLAQFL